MGHVTKDPVHLDASRGYRFPLQVLILSPYPADLLRERFFQF